MSRPVTPRPWHCIGSLVEDYRVVLSAGGDFQMLRAFKIARSIIVNVGLMVIIVLAIQEGVASPIVVGIAIVTIGLYNGIELADYNALARAVVELQAQNAADAREDE